MENKNETVADVAQLLRRRNNDIDANFDDLNIADRIEAAHRREVAELRECLKEAFELICDTYCESENCDCCIRNMKWSKALEGVAK